MWRHFTLSITHWTSINGGPDRGDQSGPPLRLVHWVIPRQLRRRKLRCHRETIWTDCRRILACQCGHHASITELHTASTMIVLADRSEPSEKIRLFLIPLINWGASYHVSSRRQIEGETEGGRDISQSYAVITLLIWGRVTLGLIQLCC